VTQIAASFVLLAGASTAVTTLIALQMAQTASTCAMSSPSTFRYVLRKNASASGRFYRESIRRIDALPGVNKTAFGMVVPWRDSGFGLQFSADGHVHIPGEDPRAELRVSLRILCLARRSHHFRP